MGLYSERELYILYNFTDRTIGCIFEGPHNSTAYCKEVKNI